jgi:hypothetical protein
MWSVTALKITYYTSTTFSLVSLLVTGRTLISLLIDHITSITFLRFFSSTRCFFLAGLNSRKYMYWAFSIFAYYLEKNENPQQIFCDSMLYSCLPIYQIANSRSIGRLANELSQYDNEAGSIAINLDLPLLRRWWPMGETNLCSNWLS